MNLPYSKVTDGPVYDTFKLRLTESAAVFAGWGSIGYAVGHLFYGSLIVCLLFATMGLYGPFWLRDRRIRKRREELAVQFKQALYALSSSLSAGRSVEHAFAAAVQDMKLIYTDPHALIIQEFNRIDRMIANGISVEYALAEFGRRSGQEDIRQFADVFLICKRTGGNLVEVMRRTSQIIGDKLEMRQEISVMIAQKRFESRIMGGSPLAIVALLRYSSPDYMAPLYGRPAGIFLMTGCLLVFAGCWWITGKIMDIRV